MYPTTLLFVLACRVPIPASDAKDTADGDADRDAGTWEELSPAALDARSRLVAAADGAGVLFLGGWDASDYDEDLQTYDEIDYFADGVYAAPDSLAAEDPSGVWDGGLGGSLTWAATAGRYFAYGGTLDGWDRASAHGTLGIRDSRGSWTGSEATGPGPRANHAAGWVDDRLVVFGGSSAGAGTYSDTWEYGLAGGWSLIDEGWLPWVGMCSASNDAGEMYIFGGSDGAASPTLRQGAVYTASTGWTLLPTDGAPSGRYGAACAWVNGYFVVWGGNDGGVLGDGALYDPDTDAWIPIASAGAPAARRELMFAVLGDPPWDGCLWAWGA